MTRMSAFLPGEIFRRPAVVKRDPGSRVRKDEMTRRENSERPVVPNGVRKGASTVDNDGVGKGSPASEQAGQLDLLGGIAASPTGVEADQKRRPSTRTPTSATSRPLPAMTMEEVASDANLRRAFARVAANDGASGADRRSVDDVRKHVDDVIATLQRTLLDGTWRPGLIRRVWIPKSDGGQRGLGIPNVVDRIVQQAVLQTLSPHYEPTFHKWSHGFRPGRSCHTAIADAKRHLEEGFEYVVDLDLEKFFDRVNHDRLMARLAERVADRRLLKAIRKMLTAKVLLPDGVVVGTEEGTPQGGPLSPLLANIVLDELDHELARRGHRFVRYADDCNIYVRSERAGQRVMESVSAFIEKRLRLKVNAKKSAVARPQDRHFVGFRLRRNSRTGTVDVLLSQRSMLRLDEKIRALTPRNWGRSMRSCIERLNEYLVGWLGFFHIVTEPQGSAMGYVDAHIRRRLRCIQLRQWGRKRNIARQLRRRGVNGNRAWRVIKDCGLWAISGELMTSSAINRYELQSMGLVSLESRWRRLNATVASRQLGLPLR